MASNLTLTSGNLNNFLSGTITSIISAYTLDTLKDSNKQKELVQELNNSIPIGIWTVVISGSRIGVTLMSKDRRQRVSWNY